MSRRGFSWRAPPENPAPRAECPWCGEVKSRAVLENGHRETRACIAEGHSKRAYDAGLVRLGALVDDDGWRVKAWLPVLLRGRAPIRILPTRAKRKGNQVTPRYKNGERVPTWYDAREVWIPAWVNLLIAGQVERWHSDRDATVKDERLLIAVLRWGGRDETNDRALAAVRATSRNSELDLVRWKLYDLFLAANPSMHQVFYGVKEKKDSGDLRE